MRPAHRNTQPCQASFVLPQFGHTVRLAYTLIIKVQEAKRQALRIQRHQAAAESILSKPFDAQIRPASHR